MREKRRLIDFTSTQIYVHRLLNFYSVNGFFSGCLPCMHIRKIYNLILYSWGTLSVLTDNVPKLYRYKIDRRTFRYFKLILNFHQDLQLWQWSYFQGEHFSKTHVSIYWYVLQTNVLDMTLNNLMVRFQQCWRFGEYGASFHCQRSQLHSGPEW